MKRSILLPALLGATLLLAIPPCGFADETEDGFNLAGTTLEAQLAAEKDGASRIRLQNSLADAYFDMGGTILAQLNTDTMTVDQYEAANRRAVSYFQKSYESDIKLRKSQAATDLISMATAYGFLEEYPQVVASMESAIVLYRELKDSVSEARTLDDIGITYANQESFGKSVEYFTRSLALWQALGRREEAGNSLIYIASGYEQQKQYAKSISFNQRALAISVERKSRGNEAEILAGIARCYRSLNQPAKQREYFERCWPIYEELKQHGNAVRVLEALMAFYKVHQPEMAIERGEKAIEILKAGPKVAVEDFARAEAEGLIRQRAALIWALAALLTENNRAADAKALHEWYEIYAPPQ